MPMHDWTRVSAGSFHTFHTAWITEIARALNNGVLPEGFYAESEQVAGQTGPDVPEQEVYGEKRNRLVIRHASGDEIIAYIEIVSSGNKSSRRVLDRFLDKACTAIERGIHLLVIDPYPPGNLDPNGIHGAAVKKWDWLRAETAKTLENQRSRRCLSQFFHSHGAIWSEIDPGAPFRFPDDRKLTLASYCAARPPQAYIEPLAIGMTLPGIALFLDPQWYVTVPLEGTYCAAWEAIPARWRRLLSERL